MVIRMETVTQNIIAHIFTDYNEKFGIPRQSGLANEVQGIIKFEPEFRYPESVRGLEGFSHLWLIWEFSENRGKEWSPTVRPPRLGGNTRMGVFATRSPFRPNPIGLSCVEIVEVQTETEDGPIIILKGPDLLNGTPILDIKPYIRYSDCREEAQDGFLNQAADLKLHVIINEDVHEKLGEDLCKKVADVLSNDPRPSYQEDSERIYGMNFSGYNIRFKINGKELTVIEAEK